MTRPALVLALRPAARIFFVADFTFLVMALRLAATLRRALDALRFNLLMALARLLPALRLPRLGAALEDFFADRFALAITSPFALKCACVLANSLLLESNSTNPVTGFISGWVLAVKCPGSRRFLMGLQLRVRHALGARMVEVD